MESALVRSPLPPPHPFTAPPPPFRAPHNAPPPLSPSTLAHTRTHTRAHTRACAHTHLRSLCPCHTTRHAGTGACTAGCLPYGLTCHADSDHKDAEGDISNCVDPNGVTVVDAAGDSTGCPSTCSDGSKIKKYSTTGLSTCLSHPGTSPARCTTPKRCVRLVCCS